LNEDEEGNLVEVLLRHGKTGTCSSAQVEALGVVISEALRSKVDPQSICRGIGGIRCPSPLQISNHVALSCPDAVANVIKEYLEGK